MRRSFLLFGALFGFLLSRAGATTYDYYAKLFLFEDFQLMIVMAAAAAVGAVGVALMKHFGVEAVATRAPIAFKPKPWTRGLIAGSLLFGVGWGLAGACPGTVLAMLGEGKLMAAFSIVGIVLGTYLHGVVHGQASPASQPNKATS
jgi:hypothetical protein